MQYLIVGNFSWILSLITEAVGQKAKTYAADLAELAATNRQMLAHSGVISAAIMSTVQHSEERFHAAKLHKKTPAGRGLGFY